MGQMLSAISHQWKQPLNAIAIIIQDLQEAYGAGELDKKYIDQSTKEILDHVFYLSKNVGEFRSFFSTSRHSINFDLIEILDEFCQLISAQLVSLDITLTLEKKEPGPYSAAGIPGEFKHAILNLVNNSREAIIRRRKKDPESAMLKGKISLILEKSDDQSILRIEDNGGGIDKSIINNIFEPYVTTSPETSFGLGLYMARLIIAQMEGVISASNSKEGAIFIIRFPGPNSNVDFL
jgi:signal transduction histidine kinase